MNEEKKTKIRAYTLELERIKAVTGFGGIQERKGLDFCWGHQIKSHDL